MIGSPMQHDPRPETFLSPTTSPIASPSSFPLLPPCLPILSLVLDLPPVVHNYMPRMMSYQKFTFLVPSDKAWRAVPRATMAALQADTKAYAQLVYLHFLPIGVQSYASLSSGRSNTKVRVRRRFDSI